MFFDGDLQSGIAKSLQESKLVACVVLDDGEESLLWETEWLKSPEISQIHKKVVLLRIENKSTEAQYLAAFCPLESVPSFFIIRGGQLILTLKAGTGKEDFITKITDVVGNIQPSIPEDSGGSQPSPIAVAATETSPMVESANRQNNPSIRERAVGIAAPTQRTEVQLATPGVTASSSSSLDTPSSHGSVVADGDKFVEDDVDQDTDKVEKAKAVANANAKRAINEADASGKQAEKWARINYAIEQKARREADMKERDRIRKTIESDRQWKRERAGRTSLTPSEADQEQLRTDSPPAPPGECALQVRLFNGSIVRSRFPSLSTLGKEVREWLDRSQPNETPYTFKHIVSPLPNRTISISDEVQSLYSLGLTPNATLVMVPIRTYTEAYSSDGKGLLSRGLNTGFGLVSSSVGMVTGAVGGIFGYGATPTVAPASDSTSESGDRAKIPTRSGLNIRTLADQRKESVNPQFYNGNNLDVEPRKDDKKDE